MQKLPQQRRAAGVAPGFDDKPQAKALHNAAENAGQHDIMRDHGHGHIVRKYAANRHGI